MIRSKHISELRFTSPIGRGRRVAPGEGLRRIDRPYPLTPTLSPWEREQADSLSPWEREQADSASTLERKE